MFDGERDLKHVGDVLDDVVSALGSRSGLGAAAALWAEWPDICGPDWAGVEPLRLHQGVLSVGVPDGMTATRVRYGVKALLGRIERRLGPDLVSAIRVQIRAPQKRSRPRPNG